MKRTEILKLALGKAIKNGWDPVVETGLSEDLTFKEYRKNVLFEDEVISKLMRRVLSSPNSILFDHGFALALWGKRWCCYDACTHCAGLPNIVLPCWKYHLQSMVLREDPIKYLEKFLQKTGDEKERNT